MNQKPRKTKKLLSLLLTVIILISIVPLGFVGFSEKKTYQVGDIIEFGSYPQSKVTDESICKELTQLADDVEDWTSYEYFSGTGEFADGKMAASDYMVYTDVVYDGNKYRGVYFTAYRPSETSATAITCAPETDGIAYQYDMGYYINTVYWFKFEPIEWTVLDPDTGMVMSKNVLDAQPFNNYVLVVEGDAPYDQWATYWGDSNKTAYANDYYHSSIREWLNEDFYNTAFTDSQKNCIMTTVLDNSAYSDEFSDYDSKSSSDKIYLLSWNDVLNEDYGFLSDEDDYDAAKKGYGSAYSECQGYWQINPESNDSWEDDAIWFLRSAGGWQTCDSCCAYDLGLGCGGHPYYTSFGVRPALNLDITCDISENGESESEVQITEDNEEGNTCDSKETTGYRQGDVFEFGSYPQSRVTDEELCAKLTEIAGSTFSWESYNYYSGTNEEDGSMTPSDYMMYKDVQLDGKMYRGVYFYNYRPLCTYYEAINVVSEDEAEDFAPQRINGYYVDTVYWFAYEPIQWQVLDAETGLVISRKVLDAQAFNNYILFEKKATDNPNYSEIHEWGDNSKTYFANNYYHSSLRQWLNSDFYNTAFSDSYRDFIQVTHIDNSAYDQDDSEYDSEDSDDRIYLLTWNDACNEKYGFSSDDSHWDSKKVAYATDYAAVQGLYVEDEDGFEGAAYWYLRSAGFDDEDACCVDTNGYREDSMETYICGVGIRPVLNLDLSAMISKNQDGGSNGTSTGTEKNTTEKSSIKIILIIVIAVFGGVSIVVLCVTLTKKRIHR